MWVLPASTLPQDTASAGGVGFVQGSSTGGQPTAVAAGLLPAGPAVGSGQQKRLSVRRLSAVVRAHPGTEGLSTAAELLE